MDKEVVVIIPTLNEEKYINACIESVQAQTYPFEKVDVIVVDGGSTDRTRDIVHELSNKMDNIRLINNPGKIQSIAFNLGVANSTAPFVIRLDAHTTYDENYIALCVQHLKASDKYGNVGGICVIKAQNDTMMAKASMILNQSKFGIGGSQFRVGTKAACVDTVPFGAFRRDVIEKVGGMREDMPRAEDNEINSRLSKNGYSIYLDPKIVSSYYARDTFSGCIKQMYNNGVSIGHLFYVDRNAIGLRHFVPFLFVIGIAVGLLLSFCVQWIKYLFVPVLLLYMLLNIIATVYECRKYGWRYLFILPWLFFSVHIAYGVGTIVGLFKYFNYTKRGSK